MHKNASLLQLSVKKNESIFCQSVFSVTLCICCHGGSILCYFKTEIKPKTCIIDKKCLWHWFACLFQYTNQIIVKILLTRQHPLSPPDDASLKGPVCLDFK